MEHRDYPILEFGIKVDQQVPAADQVHLGKWRVLNNVLNGKHDHLPDLFFDPEPGRLFFKVPPQPFG